SPKMRWRGPTTRRDGYARRPPHRSGPCAPGRGTCGFWRTRTISMSHAVERSRLYLPTFLPSALECLPSCLLPFCLAVLCSSLMRRSHACRTARLALREPFLRRVVGLRPRILRPVEDAAVDHFLRVRDRFEEQSVAGDLRDHEVMIGHAYFVELARVIVVQ